jgi:flagellar biosynthesis/type III secretory pathway M-ring protein FliF/YscJ
MDESISIALQVYFLGFVIALAMAFLIKIILVIIRRGNKQAAVKTQDGQPGGDAEKNDNNKKASQSAPKSADGETKPEGKGAAEAAAADNATNAAAVDGEADACAKGNGESGKEGAA